MYQLTPVVDGSTRDDLAEMIEIEEPVGVTFTCPCPFRGLRCADCCLIAFAPSPFRATPLGWTLATARRLGWRIR